MKRPALLPLFAAAFAATLMSFTQTITGRISDQVGRAGMAAVVQPANENHSTPVVMVAGGANFPHAEPGAKTPEQRGEKVFYSDVTVLVGPLAEEPLAAGSPPRAVGYAAFLPTDKGMLVAGGCNAEGHTAKVSRVELFGSELRVEALPDLPRTLAYPAFAKVGSKMYVLGGQEKADSTTCLNCCYVLDLHDINAGWKEVAPMPGGRMLAGAAVMDGVIYVVGGCSLAPDASGAGQRTYLKDVLCYDPGSNTWAKVAADLPESLVGMANPLPVQGDKFYVVGGDTGNYYRASLEGKAPAEHPGQSAKVYSFTPASREWKLEGELPQGVATMPAVQMNGVIYTISGETHPGIRTPSVFSFTVD